MKLINIHKYNFYLNESNTSLEKKGWYNLNDNSDSGYTKIFSIYKEDIHSKPLVFCKLTWYSETEPLRIDVQNIDGTIYYAFFSEKYNSSNYIQELHKNIIQYIKKYKYTMKEKENGYY